MYQELQGFLRANLDESLHLEIHDTLNPAIWIKHKLKPEVKGKLMKIAQDFREFLGVKDLEIQDITVSGSNAAYNYTDESDIDLHLVVDLEGLSPYARELFDAKKFQYNTQHDIQIRGYDVELYVQDSAQEHFSQGIYSVMHDEWIRTPSTDIGNIDQASTQAKYEKIRELIELAVKHSDLELAEKIKRSLKKYRQAGLRASGEFGPENLAFKALRSDGYIEQLYDFINDVKNRELSLEVSRRDQMATGDYLIAEGAVPDNRILTKIRELLAKPLRPSDLRSQMEAYFVVPDPSMLHDFRKIQAYEGDRADLRQTFRTYLATQIHPDILARLKIRSVEPPAPPIEVQPQAEIRENITAGAFAVAPSVVGGMHRRPGITKKRKKTKESQMRLSEIQPKKTTTLEGWGDPWYPAIWRGADLKANVRHGFHDQQEAQDFYDKLASDPQYSDLKIYAHSEPDYTYEKKPPKITHMVSAKSMIKSGDKVKVNLRGGMGRTRSGTGPITPEGTVVRDSDNAIASLPTTRDEDGNQVVDRKQYEQVPVEIPGR